MKDVEFWRIAELPTRAPSSLEIALGGPAPYEAISAAGWRLTDAATVTATPWTYRDYIGQSLGEFSVAVNLYVKTKSGWFSDRTAAYLAWASRSSCRTRASPGIYRAARACSRSAPPTTPSAPWTPSAATIGATAWRRDASPKNISTPGR